jgi:hypothetical protein
MRFFTSITALLLGSLSGCCLTKSEQLAAVAKDWCLTIRASQVIPVYPLTEDLQPGDIFLVQTTIDDQVKRYEESGFLPLDQHLGRIEPALYESFYTGSYGISTTGNTPHQWQFSPNGVPASPPVTAWNSAPLAAFPSYSFTVKRGGGLSLAVPVQGVPVALGLMGSSSASGTISITDSHTYGVDIASLLTQVHLWVKEHGELLSNYHPDPGAGENGYFYLRVVSRVYLAGAVTIDVNDDEAYAASVSGGAPKSVELLNPDSRAAAANFKSAIDTIGKGVDTALPGGTLKFAGASSRSVSLAETFPRPLVIGYLGFDAPILTDGTIGSIEPTHARLQRKARVHNLNLFKTSTFGIDGNTEKIRAWLKGSVKNREALAKWLKDNKGFSDAMVGPIEIGTEYAALRAEIVSALQIPTPVSTPKPDTK